MTMSPITISKTPNGIESAHAQLRELAEQRRKVTVIVFGQDEDAQRALRFACVRADGNAFRQVVHIPDIASLDGSSEAAVLRDAFATGALVVAMTRYFRVASVVGRTDEIGYGRLERIFAEAMAMAAP